MYHNKNNNMHTLEVPKLSYNLANILNQKSTLLTRDKTNLFCTY